MQLTVIGATGTIGRELVEHALEAGHDVTALTRDARRVTTRHDRLSVVEGQADAPEDCARAVAGSDAVVVVLGAGRRGGIRERDWARGPARLARCLDVDGSLSGTPALGTGPLTIEPGPPPTVVRSGPRVGVSGAGGDGVAFPWRFWADGDPSVSLYRPATARTRAKR